MNGDRASAVLGLNPGFGGFNYHDPAAALIVDGRVLAAAEEERFARLKGAPGVFPERAVEHCLSVARSLEIPVSGIAVGYAPQRWPERWSVEIAKVAQSAAARDAAAIGPRAGQVGIARGRRAFVHAAHALLEVADASAAWETEDIAAARVRQYLPLELLDVPVRFVEHHRAHAASAYWPSGMKDAAVVVLDGVGEVTTASIWSADEAGLTLVDESLIPNSLGYFFAAITEYLGFSAWEGEGKVMALAPYGSDNLSLRAALSEICTVSDTGFDVRQFVMGCLGSGLALNTASARHALASALGQPPRGPKDPLDDFHRDVAHVAQAVLEDAALAFARGALRRTGRSGLCVSGGVFLNCRLNQRLRESPEVSRFYVQPVAKDSGTALGAAWEVSVPPGDGDILPSLALGSEITSESLVRCLESWRLPFRRMPCPEECVAKMLCNGKIVFWVDGPAEFGPRALGSRSIIADPRSGAVAERINHTVKSRAPWRPFGPSILREYAGRILEGYSATGSDVFMIESYTVRPEWRSRLVGVIHPADGTTRPHLVRQDMQPRYHSLIMMFLALTGVPAVLNTSLNNRGDPIANNPGDVVSFFFTSEADVLVCEDILISKDALEHHAPEGS